MSRVLVTGAAGFIAATVVPRLTASGHEAIAVVRPDSTPPAHLRAHGVRIAACDLGDPARVRDLVERWAPRTIIDLAVVRDDLDAARRVNVDGFAALLEAAADLGAHVVHAGSSFEYGIHDAAMGAETDCRPTTALGISKLEASRLLADDVRSGRIAGCTLRLFHVYGRYEPSKRLVPRAIQAAMTGTVLPLTPAGFGHDLVHVDDVVDAFLVAMDRRLVASDPLDIATGVCTTNESVIDLVEDLVGRPIDRRIGDFAARDNDRAIWLGSPEDLTELLGRAPRSLREGLTRTIAESEPQMARP